MGKASTHWTLGLRGVQVNHEHAPRCWLRFLTCPSLSFDTTKQAGKSGFFLEFCLVFIEIALDSVLEIFLGPLVADLEGSGDFL